MCVLFNIARMEHLTGVNYDSNKSLISSLSCLENDFFADQHPA